MIRSILAALKRRRIMAMDGYAYAEYLRPQVHTMGRNCWISPRANITDPHLVSMGDNVRISDASLFCHDGSVNMLNRMTGLNLDMVEPIRIGSNVSIGHGAIVLPGAVIGSGVQIGAGSVVSGLIPTGVIAAGVPAKPIGSTYGRVERLKKRNKEYPWRAMIEARGSSFDPTMEAELAAERVRYFFGGTQ